MYFLYCPYFRILPSTFWPCGCTRDKRGCWIDWLRMVPRAKKLFKQRVRCRHPAVRDYLEQMDRFLELLCLPVHLTDDQPHRGQSYPPYDGVTAAKSRLPIATTRNSRSSTDPR
ncbi:hypothetical protein COCCADRAFT_35528 [Bipolaris zeicola 26-R-13]|uniref:Uncharacterized protein n=1 Tax=Cochliobolus carbonum (strain 26-R-13) TaxID=930089 RepID=W6Y603_COCC2|nr:uncharacterized protein COCCADRAFT_35528 [Bipolaris zeicola 26-R-13]EUC34957.1 hypothetical protein COCCADRAFT_35528 [Bipolaris zeicola 26-R-13]